MTVKVITEFPAKSGRRDELIGWIERMMADAPPIPGALNNSFYKAAEDPDLVVEIGEWESAQAREAAFGQIEASGGFAPMYEFLAAPLRVTVLNPTH
jgi:quinol monooxygenase YgiN